MADNDQNQDLATMLGLPRAKRSRSINELTSMFKGHQLTDTFELFGVKYAIRTLEPHEETWVTNHISGNTPLQVGRNQMAPYAAACLTAIEGANDNMVPIESHFQLPDDIDPEMKRLLENNPDMLNDWRRREVLAWLLETQQELIRPIWAKYAALTEKKAEVMEKTVPFSKRTPTGESSATSSPGKESSFPTLPSSE